jgi:hypothetical protein
MNYSTTNLYISASVLFSASLLSVSLITHSKVMEIEAQTIPTHYYVSPQLEDDHLLVRKRCVRPTHKDLCELTIEQRGEKLVVTTSGFGGSGITVGEGAVEFQIEEFKKRAPQDNEAEIAVLGAGIIGSLMALHLKIRAIKMLLCTRTS